MKPYQSILGDLLSEFMFPKPAVLDTIPYSGQLSVFNNFFIKLLVTRVTSYLGNHVVRPQA